MFNFSASLTLNKNTQTLTFNKLNVDVNFFQNQIICYKLNNHHFDARLCASD